MTSSQPHFFLRCEAREEANRGEWKFVLSAADGSAELTAEDIEDGLTGERLELLAVIRALEALDEPATVTLQAGARNVRRVLDAGLDEWRRNGWMWESYGEMVPIKNRDLWMRLDRCLAFHKLESRRTFRFDSAHSFGDGEVAPNAPTSANDPSNENGGDFASRRRRNLWHRVRRTLRSRVDGVAMSCATLGSSVATPSWIN